MTAAQKIADFASEALQPIWDKSGYVLYSAANSLKPCPVYLLGCNPGGSPEDQTEATVRASIDALPTKKMNNYLVKRCFRDTADADYISARACYRSGLIDQFLWLGTLAIEKYLKGILLLNEKNTKKIRHNLTKAIAKVETIPDIPWDFSPELKEFLAHLTTYGNNRYFVIPRIRKGRELFQLDNAVWSVRRYCQCLSYMREWDSRKPDTSLFDAYVTWLGSKECKRDPHSFQLLVKGYLEEVVCMDKHPEQRAHLVWKNLYYGRRRKRVVRYSKVESFSQPAHFVQPEMFKWLSTKVDFYKNLREHFEERNSANKTIEGDEE